MGNIVGKDVQQYLADAQSGDLYARRRAARELCKIVCSGSKREEIGRIDIATTLIQLSASSDRDTSYNSIVALSVLLEQGIVVPIDLSVLSGYEKNLSGDDREIVLATSKFLSNYVIKSQKPQAIPQSLGFTILGILLSYHDEQIDLLASNLLSLFSAIESYRNEIILRHGFSPILNLCRSENIDTRCLALACIGNIALDVPNKISLYQLDRLNIYLDSMEHPNAKVKTYASNSFCRFFDNCEGMLHRMDEDVFRILTTLSSSSDKDAHRAVANIFCQLSKIGWFFCNNCQKEPLESIRWTCLNCLTFNLCETCYSNRTQIPAHKHEPSHIFVSRNADGYDVRLMGIIETLIKLCDTQDGLVTLLICETFENMARNRKNRVQMVASGVLQCFRKLSTSKSQKIQRIIIATFANLVEEIENCEVAIHEHLQLIIGMTRSSDVQIQRDAARALSSLCAIDEAELKQHIINEGGLQCLVCFAYSMDKEIQQYTSLGLRNLTEKLRPLSLTYFTKNGGLQPIYYLCTSHDQMIQLNIASTLFNIISNSDALSKLEEAEGVHIVRVLLQSKFPAVSLQALAFITLFKSRTRSEAVLKKLEDMEAGHKNPVRIGAEGSEPVNVNPVEPRSTPWQDTRVNIAMVRLKCLFEGETRLIVVYSNITFAQLVEKLKHDYNVDVTIRYEDEDGDRITIKNDSDLQEAFSYHQRSGANNFKLSLSHNVRPQSRPLESFDSITGSGKGSARGSEVSTSPTNSHLSDAHRAQLLADNPNGWVEIVPEDLEVEDRIGSGSFCIVRKATWRGKKVALKIFRDEIIDAELLEIFRSELTVMCKLSHPNIIPLLGAITSSSQLCIVTEFMGFGSLFDILHKNFEIDDTRRKYLSLSIARGLEHLHSREPVIVHRDLKSANILVDENWNVKIGDLGLSRVKHRAYCSSGFSNGTFGWMSPECIKNEKYNEKADIYSYGIVLWEIVTGKIPYPNMTPIQIVAAVAFQDQRPEIPDGCDPTLSEIMRLCWAKDPNTRPSALQIVSRLEEEQRGMPYEC